MIIEDMKADKDFFRENTMKSIISNVSILRGFDKNIIIPCEKK